MLPQKTESCPGKNPQSGFFVTVSPSNRIQLSVKPLREFHRQTAKPQYQNFGTISKDIKLSIAISMIFEQLLRLSSSLITALSFWILIDFHSLTDSQSAVSLASHPNYKNPSNLPALPLPKKFTRAGRATILDAGGALEKEGYQPSDFYFFTGTLPGSTQQAMEMMSRYSPFIVNSLKQYLRDKGLYLTFNTWEWQKRGALHLHMVVHCTDPQLSAVHHVNKLDENVSVLGHLLQEKWLDLMDAITEKSGINMYERWNGGEWNRCSEAVQDNVAKTIRCQKSVAAYLSKYVGKGNLAADGKFISKCKQRNIQLYYPSSWWSISKHLRNLIQKHTYKFSTRLTYDKLYTAYNDVYEFVEVVSTLTLKQFSPDGYPDYVYQSIYVEPTYYQDIVTVLQTVFSENAYGGQDTGWARLDRFKDAACRWLKLDKNHKLLDSFVYSLPWHYVRGGIDWNSSYIQDRAANWVSGLYEQDSWKFAA